MNQREAIRALTEWMYRHPEDNAVHPIIMMENADEQYFRLLAANVAAITSGVYATDSGVVVDATIGMATKLTHATIESLVAGAKEGTDAQT